MNGGLGGGGLTKSLKKIEHSDVTKGSLTGDTVPVLWWFSKDAFSIHLVHFSLGWSSVLFSI